MMDDALRAPLHQGHVQGAQDELGLEVRFDGPADDPSGPHIEHDGEIEKPGPRRDIGDVGPRVASVRARSPLRP